jgi:pimeloyl-ACP methyl ester carboxylesterase
VDRSRRIEPRHGRCAHVRQRPLDGASASGGNAETCLVTEMPVFPAYEPDEATLAAVEVPVRVMVGPDSAIGEPAGWLAGQLGVELESLPGGHTPYFDRPQEMAEALRPMLREMSKQPG